MMRTRRNHVIEWSYTAAGEHSDPFNELSLHALVTNPEGHERKVPGFFGARAPAGECVTHLR